MSSNVAVTVTAKKKKKKKWEEIRCSVIINLSLQTWSLLKDVENNTHIGLFFFFSFFLFFFSFLFPFSPLFSTILLQILSTQLSAVLLNIVCQVVNCYWVDCIKSCSDLSLWCGLCIINLYTFVPSQKSDGHHKQEGGGAGHSTVKPGGVGVSGGGVGPTRECPECGYLNTRMAKKCVRCKGHLQGRACTR